MTISKRGVDILRAAAGHPNGEVSYKYQASTTKRPGDDNDLCAMVEVETAGLVAYARLERGATVFKLTALGKYELPALAP